MIGNYHAFVVVTLLALESTRVLPYLAPFLFTETLACKLVASTTVRSTNVAIAQARKFYELAFWAYTAASSFMSFDVVAHP